MSLLLISLRRRSRLEKTLYTVLPLVRGYRYPKVAHPASPPSPERKDGARNVRLTDDITLDFAAGEKLIDIEVVRASRLFEQPESPGYGA